jgi:hypothetical protein
MTAFNKRQARQKIFHYRFVGALFSKATGHRCGPNCAEQWRDRASRSQLLQEAHRKMLVEFIKRGATSELEASKIATQVLEETEFSRFIRHVARLNERSAKRTGRYIDADDIIILLAWDGFDVENWPLKPTFSNHQRNLWPVLRRFPPLSRWTMRAARYCINWLAVGSGKALESHITQKAYEKRVRGMDRVSEAPLLVRRAEFDKRSKLLRPILSAQGERWLAQNSYRFCTK